MGLVNFYRDFCEGLAEAAYPLTKLMRKEVQFEWGKEAQRSYEKIKELLTNSDFLRWPDFSKPFIISTDASKIAVGAVLSQSYGNEERPIAYASRVLSRAEENYSHLYSCGIMLFVMIFIL